MAEVVNLTKAAKVIGCSRPTLYKYLERPEYTPEVFGGRPTLTTEQVKAIKNERKNGKARK